MVKRPPIIFGASTFTLPSPPTLKAVILAPPSHLNILLLSIFIFPFTSSLFVGFVTPIPIFPVFVISAFVVNVPPLLFRKVKFELCVDIRHAALLTSLNSNTLVLLPEPIIILPLISAM